MMGYCCATCATLSSYWSAWLLQLWSCCMWEKNAFFTNFKMSCFLKSVPASIGKLSGFRSRWRFSLTLLLIKSLSLILRELPFYTWTRFRYKVVIARTAVVVIPSPKNNFVCQLNQPTAENQYHWQVFRCDERYCIEWPACCWSEVSS